MRKTCKLIIIALGALTAASCRQTAPDVPETGIKGAIILNNGNWGSNDASLTIYDPAERTVAAGQFLAANGQRLGDLGQDIIVLGDEIYIAMNGSRVIFVTDMDLKLKKAIMADIEGVGMAPRCLASANGKVYVTYHEGFLGEITPGSYALRTTATGSCPEGICIRGGKAYVANSGYGSGNTVSVIDLASFREEKKIEVHPNPQSVAADKDGRTLYVCSWDAYDPVTYDVISPAKFQKVDIASGEVSDMEGFSDVKNIVEGSGNQLFIAQGGYDSDWNIHIVIKILDMASGAGKGLFTEESFDNYYSLSYSNGYVFVGTSDYLTNGDVYLYKADGTFVDNFDAQGLNPQKCIYLQ